MEKKQEREEQKKLEENTSDEPPMKDMRKYKKDLNDAYIIVYWKFKWQFLNEYANLELEWHIFS